MNASGGARIVTIGAWGLGVLAGFVIYLRLGDTRAVNSDGAAQALQAWDMLHGNVLLRGWTTSDVSFYTTELPQYLLVELVRGLGQDVVHIAAAMTYTLVTLLAALTAKGTATGREAAVRVALTVGIMLAPQLDSGTNVLLSSPDHTGTSVPLLILLVFLDRARARWYVPVAVSLLLGWALIADPITEIACVIPLTLVCAFRVARGARWYELALGGGIFVSVGIAVAADDGIRALGGYTARPFSTQFAPLSESVSHNLPIAGRCLLMLFGADFLDLPADADRYFVWLHLAGATLAAAGIALAAWRFRGGDQTGGMLSQALLAGIVVTLAAFVVTPRVYGISSAREIAPVLPFAAALAGRQLAHHLAAGRLARRAALPALGVVLAGYLAGLGLELTAPAAAPQAAQLTSWLRSHRLGTGLSGYWESSVVTLASGNRVAVRPVTVNGDRVVPVTWQRNTAWYDPAVSTADFVVLFPGIDGYSGFTAGQAVVATFGAPARIYHVGAYTILYWDRNLLSAISPGQGAGRSRRSRPAARASVSNLPPRRWP